MAHLSYTFRPSLQVLAAGEWLYAKVGALGALGNIKCIDKTLNYINDSVLEEMVAKPFPIIEKTFQFPRHSMAR